MKGVAAFVTAATKGNLEEVLRFLNEKTVDVNTLSKKFGVTALHAACEAGKEDVVSALLAAGANVHALDRYGATPLFGACWRGHAGVIELILSYDKTTLDYSSERHETALHLASAQGHIDAVNCLLRHGANVHAVDFSGDTALHKAAMHKRAAKVVDLLVTFDARFWSVNKAGETPLFIAARWGDPSVVRSLLRNHGASVSVINRDKMTVLDGAVGHGPHFVKLVQGYINDMSLEWRPARHCTFPLTFRTTVETVMALWSWNSASNAAWHSESGFVTLSLELLFEIFIWLALDILEQGYIVVRGPSSKVEATVTT